ncbi:type II toxin-antitoxin system prevent-host-death family antitoxin [Bosea sp. 685]|uniref:type II toxin-antitoxin system Phd/YefM family antitoxin n=1 Tax=Bosea sp. 685 TaxID=3080057 RepID=UPI002893724C|nr:type II toxin-antitoxin system prevent-host-death family antitoxin [Bosea sp. 685]WNJ89396.1 type II toxin-antitoxin system prevent-host-death family antitoxin [Bosea sp. 685]
MKVVTYSHLRANLAKIMDQAADDHDPVIVTRANGKAAVLLSLEDFGSYEETRYLHASPANAKALEESIAELDRGESITFKSADDLKAFVEKAGGGRQDAAE